MNASRLIQEKLNKLTSEADNFRRQAAQSEVQRARVVEAGKELDAQTQTLQNQVREHQAQLGSFHRDRTNLIETKARLESQLERERGQLERVAQQHDTLEDQATRDQQEFSKQLEHLNQDLMDALQIRELKSFETYITPETVSGLVDAWKQRYAADEGQLDAKKQEQLQMLEESVQRFLGACKGRDQVETRIQEAQTQIDQLRTQVLAGASATDGGDARLTITEAQLQELESVWAEAGDSQDADNDNKNPTADQVHMQVFYGQGAGFAAADSNAVAAGGEP